MDVPKFYNVTPRINLDGEVLVSEKDFCPICTHIYGCVKALDAMLDEDAHTKRFLKNKLTMAIVFRVGHPHMVHIMNKDFFSKLPDSYQSQFYLGHVYKRTSDRVVKDVSASKIYADDIEDIYTPEIYIHDFFNIKDKSIYKPCLLELVDIPKDIFPDRYKKGMSLPIKPSNRRGLHHCHQKPTDLFDFNAFFRAKSENRRYVTLDLLP